MISILTQVGVSLVAWLILMLVCTNLTGFIVRGFFTNTAMEEIVAGDEFLTSEYQNDQRANKFVNLVAFGLITILLLALYYFWNVGLVIAALMLMVARTPDVIWEIRHGRKLQMTDMRRPAFYVLSTVLSWVSLPVLWYALYRM